MITIIAPGIYTVVEFMSAGECALQIAECERLGFEPATITTRKGTVRNTEVRDNTRSIREDEALASSLWPKLREHLPPFLDGRQSIGLNERFRFYRYEAGQRFAGHTDGFFRRANGEESRLSVMVYLNDDFVGGETAFSEVVIKPQLGMALVFRHELFHEGRPVSEGRKYVLRSDVMFNPVGRMSG